jgi:hypothetical protein
MRRRTSRKKSCEFFKLYRKTYKIVNKKAQMTCRKTSRVKEKIRHAIKYNMFYLCSLFSLKAINHSKICKRISWLQSKEKHLIIVEEGRPKSFPLSLLCTLFDMSLLHQGTKVINRCVQKRI